MLNVNVKNGELVLKASFYHFYETDVLNVRNAETWTVTTLKIPSTTILSNAILFIYKVLFFKSTL